MSFLGNLFGFWDFVGLAADAVVAVETALREEREESEAADAAAAGVEDRREAKALRAAAVKKVREERKAERKRKRAETWKKAKSGCVGCAGLLLLGCCMFGMIGECIGRSGDASEEQEAAARRAEAMRLHAERTPTEGAEAGE